MMGPEMPAELPIYYSPDYTLAGYSFDTTRKASWVAESLRERPIQGVRLVEPRPLTAREVSIVHSRTYVNAVRTGQPRRLAESQGFGWDPGLWPMVLASNGGAVAAALDALRSSGVAGSLSSGLHHAKRDCGDGFCTFNGLALAARAAQSAGAARLLIIDLDAHCGGGTHELLADDPAIEQLDVAVDGFDFYSTARADWTLDLVDEADDYLPTVRRRLDERSASTAGISLVLYNAGMDPFGGSAVGGLPGITAEILAERERLVFDWCRSHSLPVAFVLAGGYASGQGAQAELVELHRLTIEAAVSAYRDNESA
jgi:acetoin utilization deacetylase AcuC-like enzyme